MGFSEQRGKDHMSIYALTAQQHFQLKTAARRGESSSVLKGGL